MADETYTDDEETEESSSNEAIEYDTSTDSNFANQGEETDGDVEDSDDDVGDDLNDSDDDDDSSDDDDGDDDSDSDSSDDANQGEETGGEVVDADSDDVGDDLNDSDDDDDDDDDDEDTTATSTDLTLEDLSEWVSPTDALSSRILAAYNACRTLHPTAEAVGLITKAITYDRQLRLSYRRGRHDGRNEVYEEYRRRRNIPIDDDNGIGDSDSHHTKHE